MSDQTRTPGPRRRVSRTRGATSGVLLVLLGLWGALIPFIGPYFDFSYTPDKSWHWSPARGWLEVLPGGVTVLGGLVLLMSVSRATTVLGAWLGIAGGAWFAIGLPLAEPLHLGTPGQPAHSGRWLPTIETLAMFFGLGAVILAVAAIAFGRLSVVTVRDVNAAERREEAAAAEQAAAEQAANEQAARDAEARETANRGGRRARDRPAGSCRTGELPNGRPPNGKTAERETAERETAERETAARQTPGPDSTGRREHSAGDQPGPDPAAGATAAGQYGEPQREGQFAPPAATAAHRLPERAAPRRQRTRRRIRTPIPRPRRPSARTRRNERAARASAPCPRRCGGVPRPPAIRVGFL